MSLFWLSFLTFFFTANLDAGLMAFLKSGGGSFDNYILLYWICATKNV